MTAIYKRELKSLFSNVIAYIFIAFMLCVIGFFAKYYNFVQGYPNVEISLYSVIFIYLVLVPLLTMRSFAQEQQDKTMTLLYSLPLRTSEIVLGKYFALLTVYAIPMLVICVYPLILSMFGKVNFTQSYLSILAFFLLGCALIAIGMFASSLASSQIIAAIISLGALLFIYLVPDVAAMLPSSALGSAVCFAVCALVVVWIIYAMTKNSTVAFIPGIVIMASVWILYFVKSELITGLFPEMVAKLALFDGVSTFLNGLLDLSVYLLYISVCVVFVFLTVQSVEKKRYS